MWYLRPFACLYDLLQFGFGHLNGLERRREDAGRERVVDARGVELLGPEVEAEAAGPDPDPPGTGDATRDDAGVLSGVVALLPPRIRAEGSHTPV